MVHNDWVIWCTNQASATNYNSATIHARQLLFTHCRSIRPFVKLGFWIYIGSGHGTGDGYLSLTGQIMI